MACLISVSTAGAHKTSALSRTLMQKEEEMETRTRLTHLEILVQRLIDNETHLSSNST